METEVAERIDLADLIEHEQIKTLENLSKAIEALQARGPGENFDDPNSSIQSELLAPV